MNKDLYIFFHIPKTGGSSFTRLIEINTDKDERFVIRYLAKSPKYIKGRYKHFLKVTEKKLKSKSSAKQKKINYIYEHGVPYGIHKFFKRNPKYIIFFRDPGKRAISYYNYYVTQFIKDIKAVRESDIKDKLLVDNKIPSINVWIREKYAKTETGTLTMYQNLKAQGFIKGKSESDIKNMFKNLFFAGVVEHLDDDINFLSGELGFNKYLVRQNISKKHVDKIEDKDTLNILKKKNKTDQKIYEYAIKFRKAFIRKNPRYKNLSKRNAVKRKLMLPFTQVLFDPKGTLIDLSAYLKRKFPLYEKAFDAIRGYKSYGKN